MNPHCNPSTEDIERHVRELEVLIGVDEELQVRMLEIWLNTFEEKKNENNTKTGV